MTSEKEDMKLAVKKLREAFDAVNRDDVESATDWLDEDVEIGRTPFMDPPAGGREAVLEFMRPNMFERQRIELLSTEIHGNVILADLIFHAVGKGSGVEVSQTNFQNFTFRSGMVVKWEVFFDREDAERAAAT